MLSKILIVDDSEAIHALLKLQLQAEDFKTRSAYCGAAALQMVAQQPPDLVLLDVDLPDMDGFEVCRRIRENPFTMNTPVIFLTAAAKTDQKVLGLDLGASDYITKPFEAAELLARVRALMRMNSRLEWLGHRRVSDFFTESLNSRNREVASV